MSSSFKLFMVTVLVSLITTPITTNARHLINRSTESLVARLKLDGVDHEETTNCWNSLLQLQSCSGEVILFFLNGETYIGPSCCRAIRVIQNDCWPALLGSLGFTTEEGDVLENYCDSAGVRDRSPLAIPSPPLINYEPVSTIESEKLFP